MGFHLRERQRGSQGCRCICRADRAPKRVHLYKSGLSADRNRLKVDGIILEADGSAEEQELIQEAMDQNIPVVTVLTDDSSSARISFVGLNSYQLGNAYTEQILGLLKEHETTQVLLLSNSQSKTQETNLVYYQIKKELEEKAGLSVCEYFRVQH